MPSRVAKVPCAELFALSLGASVPSQLLKELQRREARAWEKVWDIRLDWSGK
jgi:hypothetical protein